MSASSQQSSGTGLAGVLLIVFIILKLTGHIDWSWWWVLSPLWIVAILLFTVALGASIMAAARARR